MADKETTQMISVSVMDGNLVFDVVNIGKIILNPAKISAENRSRAMMTRSLKDRVIDAAALSRDKETGASATPEEKAAAMQRIVDHLESGSPEWNIKGAPKVDSETIGQWVARAMVHLGKARDLDHAKARIQAYANKAHGGQMGPARKKLAEAGDIAQAILELKAAAVKTDISSDDLLGEMDD